jgi:serine phosphatase RsbU (regulator of sigma subunit)
MRKRLRFYKYLVNTFVFFNLFPALAFAQTPRLDSLLKVVATLPEDTTKANTLYEIGRAYLSELNDLNKIGEYGLKELPLARKLNYKKGIAQAMLNISIIYRTTSINHDLAMYYDRTALKIGQEIGNKKIESMALANIGLTFSDRGDNTQALDYMLRSLELKKVCGDKRGMGGLYNNIANIYRKQGRYTEAMRDQLNSLRIKEELNDKTGMVFSYTNIATLFYMQNKFDEALKYDFKAVQLIEETKMVGQGTVYGNIGNVYMLQKEFGKSLIYMKKQLAINEQLAQPAKALSYRNIASVYAAQGKTDTALVYQFKAYALSKEVSDKQGVINACSDIGISYTTKKDFTKAEHYNLEMLQLSKETGNREGCEGAYSNLIPIYKEQKQYEKALEYTTLYHDIKDSLLSKENFKQVMELNTRYETEKKGKEILLLTKDQQLNAKIIRQQQLVRWGLMGGLGLLCVSVFSIYRRYRFKQKANTILEIQKQEIQQKNILITDSIDYAKTIQEAVLPTTKAIKELLPQSFVLYKPKAIVSGDFYWINDQQDRLVCAVADCTGHGVPGAFMSLLGYNMLEDVVKSSSIKSPGAMLDMLSQQVVQRLSGENKEEAVKHGMDISLISIDTATHRLEFSGAHNSLYIVRAGELIELKADKMGIGTNKPDLFFKNQQFDLQKGDMIYLFTDGFPDQMGGPNRKKFFYPPFKELLKTISSLEPELQQEKLNEVHSQWQGNKMEQTDDVLIMGIRY